MRVVDAVATTSLAAARPTMVVLPVDTASSTTLLLRGMATSELEDTEALLENVNG